MVRQSVNNHSPLEGVIGFSRAVRVGNLIAVSGTAPIDSNGSTIGIGDLQEQTITCLQLGITAIEELNASARDVFRTRIMLTDVSRWKEAAAVHGKFFKNIQPACTFVEVKGFIRREWLVEIEIDAMCQD